MFSDADHEVIDSPEALFRHLYEEHGVDEARELDPESAPLQFWLRRHAELERAQRTTGRRPDPPPEAPAPRSQPEGRQRAEPQPRTASSPGPPARPSQPAGAGREGRRHAGFGDPLVEAVARALAGRGHDEAAVRSAIRSFTDPGQGSSGEAAVRAVFVEPMLRSVAQQLLGAPRSPDPPPYHQPSPATAPPPEAAPPPEPAPRPEAAWAVLWADLADTGRRPGEGAGAGGADRDDLMAVANAVQARRRARLLRR
jgi:hypothetical protein